LSFLFINVFKFRYFFIIQTLMFSTCFLKIISFPTTTCAGFVCSTIFFLQLCEPKKKNIPSFEPLPVFLLINWSCDSVLLSVFYLLLFSVARGRWDYRLCIKQKRVSFVFFLTIYSEAHLFLEIKGRRGLLQGNNFCFWRLHRDFSTSAHFLFFFFLTVLVLSKCFVTSYTLSLRKYRDLLKTEKQRILRPE